MSCCRHEIENNFCNDDSDSHNENYNIDIDDDHRVDSGYEVDSDDDWEAESASRNRTKNVGIVHANVVMNLVLNVKIFFDCCLKNMPIVFML